MGRKEASLWQGPRATCSARGRGHGVGPDNPGAGLGGSPSALLISGLVRPLPELRGPPVSPMAELRHLPAPCPSLTFEAHRSLQPHGPLVSTESRNGRHAASSLGPGPCPAPHGNLQGRGYTGECPRQGRAETEQAGPPQPPPSAPWLGSHLVLRGGPVAPSPPEPLGGLSCPVDPLGPARSQSSGGFL